MVDSHYFIPLIGKRFGSPEFVTAIEQLQRATGKNLSYQLIDALPPEECAPNDPLKRLYKNEQILVISSGDRVLTTYRTCAPYDDQTEKYSSGDTPYIMPRYKLTHDYDKSLTSYLIYYLSITAHRYLEVIKSFYTTPEGAELNYDRDDFVAQIKAQLKDRFELKNAFGIIDEPNGELRNQKTACKRHYKALLNNLANIIIRRAEPYMTNMDMVNQVIEKAFESSAAEITSRIKPAPPNAPINGPNEEMELMIRYNIVALKLIVHDFNLLNAKSVDASDHAADKAEFMLLNGYLMSKPEFIPTKSNGKIIEPDKKALDEFWKVMNEVHGEVGKVGAVLMWVENSKRTLEQAFAGRAVMGYAMLENRIQKIARCAYYIDSAHATISTQIRGREKLKEAALEFVDAAKLKVFTSAGSPKFADACESFTEKSESLTNTQKTHLKPAQKAALGEFISVVNSMTETKRRQEDSIDRINAAGVVNHR